MNINTNVMDIKADIKWIQKELKDVKDPTLIEAFKNLLKYRNNVSGKGTVAYTVDGKSLTLEQYNQELLDAEAEIERGELTSVEDLEKEAQDW